MSNTVRPNKKRHREQEDEDHFEELNEEDNNEDGEEDDDEEIRETEDSDVLIDQMEEDKKEMKQQNKIQSRRISRIHELETNKEKLRSCLDNAAVVRNQLIEIAREQHEELKERTTKHQILLQRLGGVDQQYWTVEKKKTVTECETLLVDQYSILLDSYKMTINEAEDLLNSRDEYLALPIPSTLKAFANSYIIALEKIESVKKRQEKSKARRETLTKKWNRFNSMSFEPSQMLIKKEQNRKKKLEKSKEQEKPKEKKNAEKKRNDSQTQQKQCNCNQNNSRSQNCLACEFSSLD